MLLDTIHEDKHESIQKAPGKPELWIHPGRSFEKRRRNVDVFCITPFSFVRWFFFGPRQVQPPNPTG
jgi:hypothetical protein